MFKRFFRKLDAIVFSGFFERYSNQKNNANLLKLASIDLDYNYTTFYQKNTAIRGGRTVKRISKANRSTRRK